VHAVTRFEEVQRFRQPWLWTLLMIVAITAAWRAWQALGGTPLVVAGRFVDPWGWIGALAIVVAVGALLFAARLETRVEDDALVVRFFPFHLRPRRFEWRRIASAEAVRYRPIRDYGGWGVRWGPAGRALNVRGDRGVRIVFTDGARLLVGSQRADELAEAIARARGL
jgi:hypothetical protein